MALTPFPSSIGQGSNPRPSDHEPSALPLDHSLCTLDIFAHNTEITRENDIENFEPWVLMGNQGKHLKNSTQGMLSLFRAYLG
jgi:hypothetical protein